MLSENAEALTSDKLTHLRKFIMNIEKRRIEAVRTANGTIGHITLKKLAIPETVKVMLFGETIIPESFDIYGHPNFTNEQQMLFVSKKMK